VSWSSMHEEMQCQVDVG